MAEGLGFGAERKTNKEDMGSPSSFSVVSLAIIFSLNLIKYDPKELLNTYFYYRSMETTVQ